MSDQIGYLVSGPKTSLVLLTIQKKEQMREVVAILDDVDTDAITITKVNTTNTFHPDAINS